MTSSLLTAASEASDALSAYAPALQSAQSKADSALRQAQDANVDLQRAQNNADYLLKAEDEKVAVPADKVVTRVKSLLNSLWHRRIDHADDGRAGWKAQSGHQAFSKKHRQASSSTLPATAHIGGELHGAACRGWTRRGLWSCRFRWIRPRRWPC